MSEILKQVPVGDLHCQRDTFATEFTTKVLSCTEKPEKGFYHVKLYDTILFPEGGGQPNDTGFIDDIPVHNIQRDKLAHIHYTRDPIPVGKEVTLKLDWDRRWDHVQQHSGQHLLSAVLEQSPYNIETVSWNLGEKRSYIDVAASTLQDVKITPELLAKVEKSVNALIVKNLPVITHAMDAALAERPESLPQDYQGEGGRIRTIEIQDMDRNPCCGTHIQSLGQLQALKLLHTENVRAGNTRIFFLFGQRVLDTLDSLFTISRQLTGLLSGPPEQFVENVSKIQQQSKEHSRKAKRLLETLAKYTVKDVEEGLKKNKSVLVYKEEADMEFLSMVAAIMKGDKLLEQAENKEKVVILAAGEKLVGGPIIVSGDSNDAVQKAGKVVMKVLSGVKGGGKGRWQGKAQNWNGIENLEKALEEEF